MKVAPALALVVLAGFGAGIGFHLAQELWWWLTGMAGFCHG